MTALSQSLETVYQPPFSVTLQHRTGLFEVSYLLPTSDEVVFTRQLSVTLPIFQLPACAEDPVWLLQYTDPQTRERGLLIVQNATLSTSHPLRVVRQEFFDRVCRVGDGFCIMTDQRPLTPPRLTPPSTPPLQRSDLCIVCGATREMLFEPCGHCVYCEMCWRRASNISARCPICRVMVGRHTQVRLA